jgi:HK97 gp10 family phage protein
MDHAAGGTRGGGLMAKIEGLDRLKKRFERLPAAVFDEVGKAIEQSADEIVQMQKRLAPKKTGALADSVQANLDADPPKYATFRPSGRGGRSKPRETGVVATITAGNTKVRYAHLVEFGTAPHAQPNNPRVGYQHPGAKAEPFFYPAYRALKKRAKGRISRAFGKGIKRSKAQNG